MLKQFIFGDETQIEKKEKFEAIKSFCDVLGLECILYEGFINISYDIGKNINVGALFCLNPVRGKILEAEKMVLEEIWTGYGEGNDWQQYDEDKHFQFLFDSYNHHNNIGIQTNLKVCINSTTTNSSEFFLSLGDELIIPKVINGIKIY